MTELSELTKTFLINNLTEQLSDAQAQIDELEAENARLAKANIALEEELKAIKERGTLPLKSSN